MKARNDLKFPIGGKKKMKRIFLVFVAILLCLTVSTPGQSAVLSNQQLTAAQWLVYYNNPWTSPEIVTAIDIGADSTIDGYIHSGVVQSKTGNEYAYFYKINLLSSTSHVVSALSFDWGAAPLSFDFGSGSANSWYGTSTDGWLAGNEVPAGGSFTPSDGTIRWQFALGSELAAGETSAWFIVLSSLPPNFVVPNIVDGGPPETLGNVYSPVPEPGTMMLLGSGLIGLAGWGRKKFRK